MKRVYLSGPMSNLPDLNFPAFHAEAKRLRGLGYDVVNPAELNPDPNTGWHECMRRDLAELLTCDALALMDGWQKSAGAHLEVHVAHRVGMEIVTAREVTSRAKNCALCDSNFQKAKTPPITNVASSLKKPKQRPKRSTNTLGSLSLSNQMLNQISLHKDGSK